MRRTCSQPAPHLLAAPVTPAGARTDPPAAGQSAAHPCSPQPLRSARSGKGAFRRRCRIGPRRPASARPSWVGSDGQSGAAAMRALGGKRYHAPFVFSFRFLSFFFVSFLFLSFLPPVTGGEQLHAASTPPCRRVMRRVSLPSPIPTASPLVPGPRRAPAEHRGAARQGVPRPRDGALRSPNTSKGSAFLRRGERAHRKRGGWSQVINFVVIKILSPRRARIGAETRPRGAGRARRAGECPDAGASRGLPRRFSGRYRPVAPPLTALSVLWFPRLPPLRTPRRNPFTGGAARDGRPCLAHFAAAREVPLPVFPARRIVPTAPLKTPRPKLQRICLFSPPPARSRCRPPDPDGGQEKALTGTRPDPCPALPRYSSPDNN